MTFQKQFEKVAIGIGFSANSTVTHNLTISDDGYHDVSESGNEFSNVAGDLTKHRTTPSSKCQLTVPIDLSKSRSPAYTLSCTKQSHGVAAKSIDICVRSKIVPLLTQKDAVRCNKSMGNFALPEVADDPEIHRESSSAPQMSLVSGRSKARVVPYSIQTTNQFKRLAKNSSYDPQNSNTQKLTGLDSSRPDTSKHSFVHSHNPVNPPKHRVLPSSSFGSLTDQSKSRQLRAPMYSSMTFQKQFEKAAVGIDFSANSSTRHKIAQLDDERYDFSEIGSEFCDISGNTPKHRQSPSLKCLSIPIDLSKSRSSSYFLSCTKQSHGTAANSSDIFPRSKIVPQMTKSAAEYRSSSSSKHQTTADQSKLQAMQHHRMSNGPPNIENSSILMRSDNFEHSVASLGNTGK
ncbi:uncharacterized protein LOC110677159 isoform X2 [Aedes aegypti]|uniref:Uncharacterized protein n=1 Tax=Aedes aegypti TaxID=7159 RepID=A0A6I8U3M7_AEDAE|nr:uncharacterized protein LOC110677159 isoform X2 [Aedes aegypti]